LGDVRVHGQADLSEIVRALDLCGRLANLLHCREEQSDGDWDHETQGEQRSDNAKDNAGDCHPASGKAPFAAVDVPQPEDAENYCWNTGKKTTSERQQAEHKADNRLTAGSPLVGAARTVVVVILVIVIALPPTAGVLVVSRRSLGANLRG
jgi:hypothetical protein